MLHRALKDKALWTVRAASDTGNWGEAVLCQPFLAPQKLVVIREYKCSIATWRQAMRITMRLRSFSG